MSQSATNPGKSPGRGAPSYLYVKTDRELREQFHSACYSLGSTIQDRINDYMRSVVAEAGLRSRSTDS